MLFPSTKITKSFHDTVIYIQYKDKEVFHDSCCFILNPPPPKKNIILTNPQISKTQVHKCTSDHGGGGCRTLCTLDMNYGLIPSHRRNVANHIIPGKSRICTRFG